MKNFKKVIVTIISVIAITTGSIIPTFAATVYVRDPYTTLQYMSDGGLFDPYYYKSKHYEYRSLNKEELYLTWKLYGKPAGELGYMTGSEAVEDVRPSYITDPDQSTLMGSYVDLDDPSTGVLIFLKDGQLYMPTGKGTVYFVYDHAIPTDQNMWMYKGYIEDGTQLFNIIFIQSGSVTGVSFILANGTYVSYYKF